MRKKRVEITEHGVVVVSTFGEKVLFDENYQMIERLEASRPRWFKYFFLMGEEERTLVSEWYLKQGEKTGCQEEFLQIVGEALGSIEYDYRIATIQPSKSNEIFYQRGKEVCEEDFSGMEWEEMSENFAPLYESSLATLEELFLWYAYRIAKGYWTLEEICGNVLVKSEVISGTIEYGGFCDGVRSKRKVVKDYEADVFYLCGTAGISTEQGMSTVAMYAVDDFCDVPSINSTGVVVLRGKNIV